MPEGVDCLWGDRAQVGVGHDRLARRALVDRDAPQAHGLVEIGVEGFQVDRVVVHQAVGLAVVVPEAVVGLPAGADRAVRLVSAVGRGESHVRAVEDRELGAGAAGQCPAREQGALHDVLVAGKDGAVAARRGHAAGARIFVAAAHTPLANQRQGRVDLGVGAAVLARAVVVHEAVLPDRPGVDLLVRAGAAHDRRLAGVCVRLLGLEVVDADPVRAAGEASDIEDAVLPVDAAIGVAVGRVVVRVDEELADRSDVGFAASRPSRVAVVDEDAETVEVVAAQRQFG